MTQQESAQGPNLRLRRARKERGWTQADVAEKIGADTKSVSRWELGTRTTNAYYRRQLSELFGKTLEELGFLESLVEESEERLPRRIRSAADQGHPLRGDIPTRYEFFTDRETILEHLHNTFSAGKTPTATYVLSGLGGIGKTVIALEYAYRYSEKYQAIFWIQAHSSLPFTTGLLKIADQLNLPEKRYKNPERVLAAVKQWMQRYSDWLMILDNVNDGKFVRDQLPAGRRGHVLITTQDQALGSWFFHTELDDLEEEQGAFLLLHHTRLIPIDGTLEALSPQDRGVTKRLSRKMGGLPLALAHAGAYIEATGCSLSEYLTFYEERTMDVLHWYDPARCQYPVAVAATWSLAFEKVQQASLAAVDLLRFYAFLHPDAIPEELVVVGSSELGHRLQHITDPLALNELLAQLLRYSLVRRHADQKTVSIHQLVQAVFRDNMDDVTQQEWAKQTIRAVSKAFQSTKQDLLQERERYFPHGQTCFAWIQKWTFCFQEAAQLLLEMGNYAQRRMYYEQAEEYLQRAIEIIEKIRASGHPDRALIYNNMASLYFEEGKYDSAELYFQKAMHIWEQKPSLGNEKIFALLLSNLAACESSLGKLDEAEQHALRAVDLIKHVRDVEHRDLAYCLNTLGGVYVRQGRNEEAERLSQQAFNMLERTEEVEGLDTARSLENLGLIREPVQIDLIKQALTIYRNVHHRDHPDIARCLNIVGKFYMERQDYVQAKQYHQQALEIYTKTRGVEHPDVIILLISLVACSLLLNQRTEAQGYYEQARSIAAKHPNAYPELIENYSKFF
jgi:tetratricopeptide (TPR) repeat protein